MLCLLRGVKLESVLPLRMAGGAFAVWSKLPTTRGGSLASVPDAVYVVFTLNQYAACETFIARRLRPSELADFFLANFRRHP